ncbi:MAG: peptidase [Cyanobacteria bacterium RYN_339]|nr:peptidase [Cyanobacteria bacterium RYN_339]
MQRAVSYLVVLAIGLAGGSYARAHGPLSSRAHAAEQPALAANPQVVEAIEAAAKPPARAASLGTPGLVGTNVIADLVERADPAVVNIDTIARAERDPFFEQFEDSPGGPSQGEEERGVGSGFIVDPGGLIVTNNHVVRGATDIKVTTASGQSYRGKVIGADPMNDLALVRVNAKGLPFLKFAASTEHVRVGDWVVAIGSPLGLSHTVSVGIISAMNRGISLNERVNFLQTDAAINPGNSGGPLLNIQGEVVGVNTAIAARGQGIGFAIPCWTAMNVIGQLKATGHVERTWLGVSIRGLNRDGGGVMVVGVAQGGPAASAGLRPGDVIVAIDQRPVKTDRDLLTYLNDKRSGTQVQLTVEREGKRAGLGVTLQAAPTMQKK